MKKKTDIPYQANQKDAVPAMFDNIAPSYDRLNHILTMGIDRIWRKKMISMLQPLQNKEILDVATGTGDLAFAMIKHLPKRVHGIDISEKMIAISLQKMNSSKKSIPFSCSVEDVLKMSAKPNTYDVATISFGIRNFSNPSDSIAKISNVLRSGGKLAVLEFFHSKLAKKNRLFRWYMKSVLPRIGRLLSKHNWAYNYLFHSIECFLSEDEFVQLLEENGFTNCRKKKLLFGMAYIVVGDKK